MRAGRIPIWTVLVCVLAAHSAFADKGNAIDGEAEVKSDRLEVEHKAGKARFSGNVRATWTNLAISCEEMTVLYDGSGQMVSLEAAGKVAVVRNDVTARANSASLDVLQGLLVLEGNPSLTKGPNRIEGEQIRIHLSSGRLEVVRARGRFKIEGRER